MTKKEVTNLFGQMALNWRSADMFKGGMAMLGPTIEIWTASLADVDWWTAQRALILMCRECKYPPNIAEFYERAMDVEAELKEYADRCYFSVQSQLGLGYTVDELKNMQSVEKPITAALDADTRDEFVARYIDAVKNNKTPDCEKLPRQTPKRLSGGES